MKKLTLITSSLLAFLAVSAFTINSLTKEEPKAHCCQPQTKATKTIDCLDIKSLVGNTEAKSDALFYSVVRKHFISYTKAELQDAKNINALIPNYPSNWIDEYKHVTMTFVRKGKEEKIVTPDNKLTATQQEMLKSMDVNDYVTIEVKYWTRNVVTNEPENGGLRMSIGIIPTTEAYYTEGYEELITYLTKNSQDDIRALKLKKVPDAQVEFTINEEGKAIDAKLIKSTQNEKVDELLLELIESMPDWKPALDENGTSISQKFEFRIGVDMC